MELQEIHQMLLGSMVAVLGFCARVLYKSMTSLQELNIKIGIIIEQVKDHEQRLRVVEIKKKTKHGRV